MLCGQVPDFERAGFSPSDEQKGGLVQARWGEDGVALMAVATNRASWNNLKWGYGTWPAIPCNKWKGVTIADAGQGIVTLSLWHSSLTGECPGPTRIISSSWMKKCHVI